MPRHIRIKVGYTTPPIMEGVGNIGGRPTLYTRPTAADTGPRQSTLTSMTGPQAMTAIKAAPIEADGKKYLRRAYINGNLNLGTTGSDSLVFEDCVIDGGRTALYTISAFYTVESVEPATWPEFRWCEITGGTSACLRGGWVRFLRCDINRGNDLLKPFQGLEVWGSYLHDNYRDVGDHCDTIQIVNGCSGALFHRNSFVGYTSSDSPEEPNSWVSGVLQTGTIVGPIGTPDPVQFIGNWVEGGRIGYRGSGSGSDNPNGYYVSMIFRNNQFIRDSFQFGAIGNIDPANEDIDSSNVWADTGESIL